MYIHKIIDDDGNNNWISDSNEWDFVEGSDCPYKNKKHTNGYCSHCCASLTYYKDDQTHHVYSEEDYKDCIYPEVDKLARSLTKFYERFNDAKLEPINDFCPIEMFEGFGTNGPERRIDPELVIQLAKDNITDINVYLKWNDEEYTKEEWSYIQASILTIKLINIGDK